MLYESIEHADDTVVRFGNKIFLKIESNAWEFAWGNWGILYYKTNREALTALFLFNFHVSKIWLPAQRACWNNIYKSSEFTFLPAAKSCQALGVEDPNIVPDAQITASSNYLSYYPRKGRLNGDSGWCQQSSKITDNYIQVDMGAGRTVCGVATQGKANGSFIKSYRLSFSTDGTSWTAYKEQNVEKVQRVTVTF